MISLKKVDPAVPFVLMGLLCGTVNAPAAVVLCSFGGTLTATRLVIKYEINYNLLAVESLRHEIENLRQKRPRVFLIALIVSVAVSQASTAIGVVSVAGIGMLKGVIYEKDKENDRHIKLKLIDTSKYIVFSY